MCSGPNAFCCHIAGCRSHTDIHTHVRLWVVDQLCGSPIHCWSRHVFFLCFFFFFPSFIDIFKGFFFSLLPVRWGLFSDFSCIFFCVFFVYVCNHKPKIELQIFCGGHQCLVGWEIVVSSPFNKGFQVMGSRVMIRWLLFVITDSCRSEDSHVLQGRPPWEPWTAWLVTMLWGRTLANVRFRWHLRVLMLQTHKRNRIGCPPLFFSLSGQVHYFGRKYLLFFFLFFPPLPGVRRIFTILSLFLQW